MPTTTAQLSLSSADLTGDALQLTSVATLTGHASNAGLSHTTGVNRITLAAAPRDYVLADQRLYPQGDKAHKVYIKNLSASNSTYIEVSCGAQDIGRLYGGDWLFMPWNASQPIVLDGNSANTSVEYMVIYEQ